ncbi:MAG: hypothetical protein E6K53_02400 [Gammaproteobacteria bacterium]|nr:MAG: hypothetical protein E6K53_02400 [Gammaproteobacteria bacterium]
MHRSILLVAGALLSLLAGCQRAPAPVVHSRVVVIGFDGMDPNLAERWMADGTLPHFAQLAKSGHYQRLATTNPPQSPVAWAHALMRSVSTAFSTSCAVTEPTTHRNSPSPTPSRRIMSCICSAGICHSTPVACATDAMACRSG